MKRERREKQKAEVTAFLALIFLLLVSFVGGVMESASIQSAKSYRRADMNRAIESVFAEYQKELLEEYDILALEASYESGEYSEERFLDRFDYYGAGGMDQEIERIQLLTDDGGTAFEEQIARYIESKYGLSSLNSLLPFPEEWEDKEEEYEDAYDAVEEEKGSVTEMLETMLSENEVELPLENNPLPNISNLGARPLTELVMSEDREVSDKSVSLSEASSHRTLNQGRGDFRDIAEEKEVSKIGLGEYMLSHFSCAAGENEEEAANVQEESEEDALEYELEYILAGKKSDRENLDAVLKKLLMFRFVPNYAFLQKDQTFRAQAEALALTLSAAVSVPAVTETLTQVLLLAWAFGESIMDLRSLMKGNRVPLMKDVQNWQLSLGGLLKIGTEEDVQDGTDSESGLSYEDYMRGLICLGDKTSMCRRCLDLVEWDLRLQKGLSWFRVDQCISKVEVQSTVEMRRGITYRFCTYYGYR